MNILSSDCHTGRNIKFRILVREKWNLKFTSSLGKWISIFFSCPAPTQEEKPMVVENLLTESRSLSENAAHVTSPYCQNTSLSRVRMWSNICKRNQRTNFWLMLMNKSCENIHVSAKNYHCCYKWVIYISIFEAWFPVLGHVLNLMLIT